MALPKNDEGMSEQQILDATEERMKVLGGDPSADEIVPDNESVPAEDLEEVDEDAEEGDDLGDDDGGDDDSTPEDDDEEDDADTDDDDDTDEDAQEADDSEGDEDPQLTDAYYRAAIHGGYDEKEIVEFMKANPELAIKTFSKMHDQMNSVSNEYANIGRYKKEQANKATPTESTDKPGFKKIDLEKLRADYPDDALVDVIEQMQDQNQAMFDELDKRPTQATGTSQLATDQQKLEADRVSMVGEQIDSFFRGPGMDQYAAVYGSLPDDVKNWDNLLPSEKMNRVAVVEQVTELMEGAKMLGKNMEVTDALSRAHLLITQPVQEKMIRKDIMDKVRKRSKSITLKPNGKSTPAAASKSSKGKSAKDIEGRAADRLAKLFN
jgi:hypothetical protein